MDTRGPLTAICRFAAVLAVAGVVSMHVLTSGHHADLPASGGQAMVMSDTVTSDTVTSDTSGGPTLPGTLVQVCLAVLLAATTTLLLLLSGTRRRRWPWVAAWGDPSLWALHVPSPRAPCLFTLGVLRT